MSSEHAKTPLPLLISDLWERTPNTPTGKCYGGIAGRYWLGEKGGSERYAASALFGYPVSFPDKEQTRRECRELVTLQMMTEIAHATGLEVALDPEDPRIEWHEVWHKNAVPPDPDEDRDTPIQISLQQWMAAAAYTQVAKRATKSLREYLATRGDIVPEQEDTQSDLHSLVRRLRADATRSIDAQREADTPGDTGGCDGPEDA